MKKGRIISINAGLYEVYYEDKTKEFVKTAGKFRNYKVSENSKFKEKTNKHSNKIHTSYIKLSPKVGDICLVENKMIIDLEERKNSLIRPDVSNVDQILLVFAAKEPDFSFLLLDLFLVNIQKENIKPILIISKIDKLTDEELLDLKNKLKYYEDNLGISVYYVNSLVHRLVEIVDLLPNKISIVAGQTGAGKSTLINALIPGFNLKTNEISQALGRGKHTTRVTSLYLYNDGFIGDTPGFSKLDLSAVKKEELRNYYLDFSNYHCKFNDCLHLPNTKGCLVCEAINNDEMLKIRYQNYLKLLEGITKNRGI